MEKIILFASLALFYALNYAALTNGVHVYWYKIWENNYNIEDPNGPALPAQAIKHGGKIVTANNSTGLGFSGSGFSCGSERDDDQGWCGVFFSANLNDASNAGGHADSAFLCGEYTDWASTNGALCDGGPITIRCGVADVSFGLMMWGTADAMPDDAVWADLDPMNTLNYSLPLAGAEETFTFTALQGRIDNSAAPLLDSQFVRIDVTDQVNWILSNAGPSAAYGIVMLSQTGVGSTGKFSLLSNENCQLAPDASVTVPNVPWSTDGNTVHLVVYGSAEEALDAEPALVRSAGLALEQNAPNPFNPMTTIAYNTGNGATGQVKIYNAKGAAVYTALVAGSGSLLWNAETQPSGVYFCVLSAGNAKSVSRKMILMK